MVQVPKEVIQAVLDYISTKPYIEVYQLITKLQTESKKVETQTDGPSER